jgi:hypothetical protein
MTLLVLLLAWVWLVLVFLFFWNRLMARQQAPAPDPDCTLCGGHGTVEVPVTLKNGQIGRLHVPCDCVGGIKELWIGVPKTKRGVPR